MTKRRTYVSKQLTFSEEKEATLTVPCSYCLTPINVEKIVSCVCAKYGMYAHDQAAYCNDTCLLADHPDE